MELKLLYIYNFYLPPPVWIEPLWNWNELLRLLSGRQQAFELNLYGIEIKVSNHTFQPGDSLNWTFMELKWGIPEPWGACVLVWIEPLWNWNFFCFFVVLLLLLFELNLYGIEMKVFELNLYGIEIAILNCNAFILAVWIEPLWNWNPTILSWRKRNE